MRNTLFPLTCSPKRKSETGCWTAALTDSAKMHESSSIKRPTPQRLHIIPHLSDQPLHTRLQLPNLPNFPLNILLIPCRRHGSQNRHRLRMSAVFPPQPEAHELYLGVVSLPSGCSLSTHCTGTF